MGDRIPPMAFRKVDRMLRAHGFLPVRPKGSHVFYEHSDGRATVVPRHASHDIPPGLVRKILRDADLTRDALKD